MPRDLRARHAKRRGAHAKRFTRRAAFLGTTRPWQTTPLLVVLVCGLAGIVAIVASATTTLLDNTTFTANDVSGNWVKPTASSGTNGACLTAGPTDASSVIPNCSPTTDSNGSGALQLTTNAGNLVGATYYGQSLPTSEGLDMSFDSYQFDGSGADGISFSLAAVNPADPVPPSETGALGGALGYSTNGTTDGLPDGYLGLGLDVYGNYENTDYSGSGCSTPSGLQAGTIYPESVTARGPGNGTAGYCILASTAQTYQKTSGGGSDGDTITNLSSTQGAGGKYLDNQSATSRSSVEVPVEIVLNPSSSAVDGLVSGLSVPGGDYMIAFEAVGSSTWQDIEGALPTTSNNTELATFPSSWIDSSTGMPWQLALGWTSSTGGSNEIHDINNFEAYTLFGQVPTATVTNTDNQSGQFIAGGNTTFTVTPGLEAGGGSESQTVTMTDTFPSGITPGTASGTGWSCSTSASTVTCTTTPSPPEAAGTNLPAITIPATISAAATGSLTSTATVSSDDDSPASASDTGTVYTPGEATPAAVTYPHVPTLSVSGMPSNATGTISFTTGATTWCTATLPATSCSPASLNAGSYSVTATYSGNTDYSSDSMGPVTMVSNKDATTTTVSEAPASVRYGNEAASIFTVNLSTGNGESVPNGETVTVSAGSANCTVTLNSDTGTCTIANTALPAGGPSR